jgi:hypothetical protein
MKNTYVMDQMVATKSWMFEDLRNGDSFLHEPNKTIYPDTPRIRIHILYARSDTAQTTAPGSALLEPLSKSAEEKLTQSFFANQGPMYKQQNGHHDERGDFTRSSRRYRRQ